MASDLIDSHAPVTFQDISTASYRIRDKIARTPLVAARSGMREITKMDIYFKMELSLETGSFKERGARNTLKMLSKAQQAAGVIAASAGNHALALAYHGLDLGIPVTVVMPKTAPLMKVNRCQKLGANVIISGQHIGESKETAMGLATERNLKYVNGYDDPAIIAGQGTIGLEILESLDSVDAVVIPTGGGGMLAGIALAIKTLRPEVLIIAVEPSEAGSWSAAVSAGEPVSVQVGSTLADGLAVPKVGDNAFKVGRNLVDKVVQVNEKFIALAILRLIELEKVVCEGAGAAGLAACISGLLPELIGKRVVVPLCGGNIDTTVLGRAIERGLAADGRLVRFIVTVDDRPGGIAGLARIVADAGVSIKDIFHERAWLDSSIFNVQIKCIVETRDFAHALSLKETLELHYKEVLWGTNIAKGEVDNHPLLPPSES